MHAEPEEALMPLSSRRSSIDSPSMPSKQKLTLPGSRFSVSPFKSQNMALNSAVTKNGGEMGRAQAVQAAACRVLPAVEMNPILLKPTSDRKSQVVILGEVFKNMDAREYFSFRRSLIPTILDSYNRLAKKSDIVVIEGAGSPAEINLRDGDIVNMGLARLVNSPVFLCTDIDKGGSFASLFGTVSLLQTEEKRRVRGFFFNRFRGDVSLLSSGIAELAEKTGIPTLGVLPFVENLKIDGEDSLSDFPPPKPDAKIKIGVVKLPFLSNLTDILPLARLPFVSVEFFSSRTEISNFDAIILPGTKNAISALDFLFSNSLSDFIRDFSKKNLVFGGFQLLGNVLDDRFGIESGVSQKKNALSLLPVSTIFYEKKTQNQVCEKLPVFSDSFNFFDDLEIRGYELHHGQTFFGEKSVRYFAKGNVFGTYVHGFFDSDCVLRAFVRFLFERKSIPFPSQKFVCAADALDEEISRFAKIVRESVDLKKIYDVIFGGKT